MTKLVNKMFMAAAGRILFLRNMVEKMFKQFTDNTIIELTGTVKYENGGDGLH